MKIDKKICLFTVLMVLTLLVLPIQPQPAKTQSQFTIAAWEFPDEYGQGLESIILFENSTGSFLQTGVKRFSYDSHIYNWTAGVAIKLRCYSWINSTLVGAADDAEAQNLQQHIVTVLNSTGATVFSQQNFTQVLYYPAIDPPLWYYAYEVVLNFIPDYGHIYTVIITYETFYSGE